MHIHYAEYNILFSLYPDSLCYYNSKVVVKTDGSF